MPECPADLWTAAVRICEAYHIGGQCDPGWIANVIARETGRGDGCSTFTERYRTPAELFAPSESTDAVVAYGYRRTPAEPGVAIRCESCGAGFPHSEGPVMRGHASRCPVNPRRYPVPGSCDA